MSWSIRVATGGDLAAIMVIERASFLDDAWSTTSMHDELERAETRYFVAESDGVGETERGIPASATPRIDGYAGVLAPRGASDADVLTIAVADEQRGQGIGRALLRALIDYARTQRTQTLFLEVRADNRPAIDLYDSEGFTPIGVRKGYYRDGADAMTMRLPLRAGTPSVVADSPTATDTAPTEPLVLGIESSCDETGVGIVRGTTLLANVIASSMDEHARYGGVVPEIAARAHLEALRPTLDAAVAQAGIDFTDVDAIAVTAGPGLAGALMVGVAAAKALAVATGKPLYAVNHLVGHVGADVLDRGRVETPTIALLVSGGHTSLLLVRDLIDDVETLGETIDDAAGEAFDKVARLLGLPYPGGPHIQRAAAAGDPAAVHFPRGLMAGKDRARHRYDFSFSGVKSAVARYVADHSGGETPLNTADVAAGFQESVVDVLLTKALAACADLGVPRLLLGGGVVANGRLREEAIARCAVAGVELRIPDLSLCTDNGAMIAALGAQLVRAGHSPSRLDFSADSTLPATEIQLASLG